MYGSINAAGPLSALGGLLPFLLAFALGVAARVPGIENFPVAGGIEEFPVAGSGMSQVGGHPLVVIALLILAVWTLSMAVVTARRILPRHEA